MSEHTPKKRRLEPPSPLHKPFKSPFRRSTAAPPSSSPPPSSAEKLLQSVPSSIDARLPSSPLTTPKRPVAPKPRSQLSPELVALQRKHTQLISQSRAVGAELDTIKQAIGIEEADKDVELERLIEVWRSASQNAAEEIFATVKDKVNKMGGVIAWRKKEQDRKERMEAWSREEENQDDDDDDDGDDDENGDENEEDMDPEERTKRDELREAAREARVAAREARRITKLELAEQEESQPAKKVVEEYLEDEAFTMDMMLKELKVDLDLIGFDAGCQKWVD